MRARFLPLRDVTNSIQQRFLDYDEHEQCTDILTAKVDGRAKYSLNTYYKMRSKELHVSQ